MTDRQDNAALDVASIYCPQCGYDLRGIPERRCPECGFAYNHAAIRSIASSRVATMDAVFRHMILVSVVALTLALPKMCIWLELSLIVAFPMITGAVVGLCVAYRYYSTPRPPGFADHWFVRLGFVLGMVWFVSMLFMQPQAGMVIAGVFLIVAWCLGVRSLWQASSALQMSSVEVRQVVRIRRVIAVVATCVATLVVGLLW